ncbi:MAG: RHS repeat-associated core domain-containing protein [Gemmatimonadota bacterium]
MSSTRIRLLVVVLLLGLGVTGTAVARMIGGSVDVTPNGGSGGSVVSGTSGHSLSFTVDYENDDEWESDEFDFTCTANLGGSCSVSPSSKFMDPGQSTNVTVTYNAGSQTGTANVTMRAEGAFTGFIDTGNRWVTVTSAVTVTASGVPSQVLQYSTTDTASFSVKNETGSSKTYSFTCEWGGESCTNPSNTSIAGGQTKTIKVPFVPGDIPATHTLKLTATSGGASDSDQASVTVTDFLSVNALGQRNPVYAKPNVVHTDTFEVRFPGQTAQNFNLSVSCPGGTSVRSCSVLGGTTKSIGDTPVTVPIQYTAGANNDTSSITLTATLSANSAVTTSGELEVVAASGVLLSLDDATHGLEIDRGECANVSAGRAAIVCGDFQVTYPITPVTRMNRSFQLGLIHNTDLTAAWDFTGANFVLPAGVAEPDSIEATWIVNDSVIKRHWYRDGNYAPGENTRLSFYWAWSSVPDGMSVPSYDVELRTYVGTSLDQTVTASSKFLSLSSARRYGRAWWIAGLEQLAFRGDTIVWTGGDTGGAVYLKSGSNWIKQTRSVPDTIVKTGSLYVRRIPGGGEVQYTSYGYQHKTIDRNDNETHFNYSSIAGWTRLTSVEAPTPAGGTESIYELTYDATNGGMTSIKVKDDDGSGWDTYTVHSRWLSWVPVIDSITTPTGETTRFDVSWGPINRVIGPAFDTTHVLYNGNSAAQVHYRNGSLVSSTYYRDASRIGSSTSGTLAPAPVAELFSRFDGPLAGSADTTRLYTTGWNTVRGVVDALGNETWIDREDEDFPGLPTRVRYPNGREVETEYTSLGLMSSTTDRSTGSTTRYSWNTTHLKPDTIWSPEGVTQVFTYDSDGNRLSEKVVGGQPTSYLYDSDGLLIRIRDGLSHRDTLAYDSLGNLKSQKSAEDVTTRFERDYRGRVTRTYTPIDGADDRISETTYDDMGRVLMQETTNEVDDHWTRVHTEYDTYGRRTKTAVFGDTTTAAQDSMTAGSEEWLYDALGRVIRHRSGEKTDSMAYDLAGNVTELYTDRGHTISMEYDVLGRMTERVTPSVTYARIIGTVDTLPKYSNGLTISADTVTYTYDAMGQPLTINNDYAEITRTYTPDGLIATDKQAIRNWGSTVMTNHVYELTYVYDQDRRRVALGHPDWLSSGTDWTEHEFDSQGRIETITGPLGDSYTYHYDNANRIERREFPGAGTNGGSFWTYNDDNQLLSHRIRIVNDTVLEATMTRNDNGTVKSIGGDATSTMEYTGLGAVSQSVGLAWEGDWKFEEFVMDPFGAQLRNVSLGGELGADSVAFKNTLNSFGSIVSVEEEWASDQQSSPANNWVAGTTSHQLDASGNREYTDQRRHTWTYQGSAPLLSAIEDVTYREESRAFYSADNRMMVYQVNRDSVVHDTIQADVIEGSWGAYEEYWYDGLGRRVLKRSRQDAPHCEITNRCRSTIERYVYDGNQVLWELKQDGTGNTKKPNAGTYQGTIGYVHGGDIDAPLAMMRGGSAIVLHQSWRGTYAFSTDTDGDYTTCTPLPYGGCPSVPWPAGNGATFFNYKTHLTPYWYGSLVLDQRDATGLSYRRNRYYDPQSGQFTQTDPIGIAGGLNTYGYGGGDPVNYSDPMGLTPVCPWCVGALLGAIAGMGVEAGAQLLTGEFNGPAIAIAGAAGGAAGAAATTAALGAAAKTIASVVVSAAEGVAKDVATGREITAGGVAIDAALGIGGGAAGNLVEATSMGSGLRRTLDRLSTDRINLSVSQRADVADRLRRLDEEALLSGMVAGGVVGAAGSGGGG